MIPYITLGVAVILFIFSCCGAFAPLLTGDIATVSYWRYSPKNGDGVAAFDSEKGPFCNKKIADADCDKYDGISPPSGGGGGGGGSSCSTSGDYQKYCSGKTGNALLCCACDYPVGGGCQPTAAKDACKSALCNRRRRSFHGRKLLAASAKDICEAKKAACPKLKSAAAFGVMTWMLSVPALIIAILPIVGKPAIPMGFVLPVIMAFFSLISWAVLISTKFWSDKDGDLVPLVLPPDTGTSNEKMSMGACWIMELLTFFLCFGLAGLLFMGKSSAGPSTEMDAKA